MSESRPFVDFKAIKARVSMLDVLGHYGITLKRANQTTLKGNCPLPTHSSGSKDTFFVNEAKSVWYCHSASCKRNGDRSGGNVIDFVAVMEEASTYDAAKRLGELFAVDAKREAKQSPAVAQAPVPQMIEPPATAASSANKVLVFKLKDVNPNHPMIQARGVSIETAKLFGIGFFPGKGSMAGRIVFPLHEHGNLVGYAGRTTLPVSDANPKWLLGKGLRKTFLYGLERCDPSKPVVLVESFWGPPFYHGSGMQVAALMGAELTEEQERCLDPFPLITIALDNDQCGIEKSAVIRERLQAKHRVFKARLKE